MKRLAVCLALSCAAVAHAETDLLIMGKAFHFGANSAGLNEYNPGIGLEYRSEQHWFVGGLTYYDSFRKQAYAGYVGYQYDIPISTNWTVFGALRLGYLNGSGFHGLVAIPTIGVQYKRVALEAMTIPRFRSTDTNCIGLFARVRF